MPDTLETVLAWTGRALEPRPRPAPGESAALLVADSWLVVDGRARAASLHWARFAASCREEGIDGGELTAFRAAAEAALPRDGRWFPRVELTPAGLALVLRAAPAAAATRTARVVVSSPGDPRTAPRRKGPDLELLIALRARARAAGADELLLRDDDGALREGALSSLLWWEDGALCTTPDEHVLPGVTRALLLGIARERGVAVVRRAPHAEELAGRETWLTSALHGIRVVSAWLQPRLPAGAAERADEWRAALERAEPTSPDDDRRG